MTTDYPLQVVRAICESFEGKPFTIVDAARRMVQAHPSMPSQVFSDGWDALVRRQELVCAGDGSGMYTMTAKRSKV